MTTLTILTKRIPAGGFGRQLTKLEWTRLSIHGRNVSRRAVVIQDGADWVGLVYEPVRGGGLSSVSGMRVRLA